MKGDNPQQLSHGDLVRLIDVNGADCGLVLYLGRHPPGTDHGRGAHNGWHFSVIGRTGEVKHLNTLLWTLIPADPDSCNGGGGMVL